MNKLILSLAALLVLGGGAYVLLNGSGPADTPDASKGVQSEQSEAKAGEFNGSFFDLAKRGGDWKCVIDASADVPGGQAVSSGTVYVSGAKVRGDFTSVVSGYGNVEGHMISDGADVYVWSSVLPQGFKMKAVAGEGGSGATSGQGMDANQKYSYDCEPASANASLFTPPSDVTFQAL